MSLKALAAEAQDIILAMPDQQRHDAVAVIRQVVLVLEKSGTVIPERLVRILVAALVETIAKVKMGRKLEVLAVQVMHGAPLLLEPHRAAVEDLVAAFQKER